MNIRIKKGFTLLEVLLVIALMGILFAILLVAINPTRQLAQSRNLVRQADINEIYEALEYYRISQKNYPAGITGTKTDICDTGSNSINQGTIPTGCIDLRVLVPTYLLAIPKDPSGILYQLYRNPENNKIGIESPENELGQSIAINPISTTPNSIPAPTPTPTPAPTPTPTPTPTVVATGGTETTIVDNGISYKVHTFLSSSTFTVTNGGNVEYLVIAGGGGGGRGGDYWRSEGGGGGGAGGLLSGSGFGVTSKTYEINIGAGGAGSIVFGAPGSNGNNSVFDTFIAIGGGGGGSRYYNTPNGVAGGSGGGSAGNSSFCGNPRYNCNDFDQPSFFGGTGVLGQGYAGGMALALNDMGGSAGGGGAGGVGADRLTDAGGNGGAGFNTSISGSPVGYAGGGGGGGGDGQAGGNASAGGGLGGNTASNGANAISNTGGGGGGGGSCGCHLDPVLPGNGGNGGSGIVIIRYPTI